jgi:hypothetical protein
VAGYCEHGNEPSGSIKGGDFVTIRMTAGLSRRTLLEVDVFWVVAQCNAVVENQGFGSHAAWRCNHCTVAFP